ncbi:MAG: DUF4412 domain-containing protein [Candidatus Aminicenantes bacterium]|jgi:hypothetical protein
MKKCLIVFFLIVIPTGFVTADVYIRQKIHTDAVTMMGQTTPAKDEFSEMWIGKNKMAVHQQGQSFIIDRGKNTVYMINKERKTYIEMIIPVDFSEYLPEEAAQMAQMMLNTSVTVQPTGETQKIGEWNCSGYDINIDMMMFKMKTKVWAAKNVPFDWKGFMNKIYPEMLKVTMRLNDQSVQEISKIDGFWIKSETTMNMMGSDIGVSQEVEEISKKAAPAGTYSVPEGYTKQDKLSMEDIMKR